MARTYDEAAMSAAIELLKTRSQTIDQLATTFGRSRRSIRRWLAEMSARGHRVVRDGPGFAAPFVIVRGRAPLQQ